MSLENVAAFLKQTIGLDASSIGSSAIEQAVRQRCELRGIPDPENYWAHLCSSEREQQELIEAVVVPETCFFRHGEALTALVNFACRTLRPSNFNFRALSLPCSTGEEPYSIAMALFDAGLSAMQFSVDGVDISERAIEHARRGVYGQNSFRGADLSFRERHFEPAARGFRLSERVRSQVRFRQANLFAADAFPEGAAYDAIFCRNVLIYFDLAARQRALEVLQRLLAPEGMLFVGPAEGPLFVDCPLISTRIPLAFAFVRAESALARSMALKPPHRESLSVSRKSVSLPPSRSAETRAVAKTTAVSDSKPELSARPPAVADSLLERARKLADEGKFDEALRCCEQHLRSHAQSVDAYYLGGLLCDARGDSSQAREYYRRVLYLDPSHYEALIHLAETLRSAGDRAGADQLLERARRAQSRGRAP